MRHPDVEVARFASIDFVGEPVWAAHPNLTGLTDLVFENISPREIEEALLLHADVADAAVFGVPDKQWGESAVAAVRLKPGAQPNSTGLEEFLRERLSRHKVPRQWQFVEQFPVTPSGKIQKFVLRERYLGEARPAAR